MKGYLLFMFPQFSNFQDLFDSIAIYNINHRKPENIFVTNSK